MDMLATRATSRRKFLRLSGALMALSVPFPSNFPVLKMRIMKERFDVIIVGGSYAGLAAGMALGRALRNVLIIDAGKPANRFTPYSHNFITQDGTPPATIASLARQQVDQYDSVMRVSGLAVHAEKRPDGFLVQLDSLETFQGSKLIFATGVVDLFPSIPGFSDCWGKSVLHCPYCHGYEVRGVKTGILGNGDFAFEFGTLISNWTDELAIFTNGLSTLTPGQISALRKHHIPVIEDPIKALDHTKGSLKGIVFENGRFTDLKAIYSRPAFAQHSDIPKELGCELTPEGYIQIDGFHRTSVPGVFACGDNVTKLRTVANAVSMGTTAGMMVNKELIQENF